MANLFNTAHHAAHGLNPVAALINGAMNTNTGHTGYGFNPFTAVANGVTQFSKVLYTWQQRANERKALKRLDERLLIDIGLPRHVAIEEADKPFWRR
jgi:uncharacterized protein YjiS (DUF1127 family)